MAGVIDHVDIVVRDLPASKEFYEAALEPLGFALIFEDADSAGFGTQENDDFWIRQGPSQWQTGRPGSISPSSPHQTRLSTVSSKEPWLTEGEKIRHPAFARSFTLATTRRSFGTPTETTSKP